MPEAPITIDGLVSYIAQSEKNLGIDNANLPGFVQFLVGGRVIQAAYVTAMSTPGTDKSILDMLILATGSLFGVTVYQDGRVSWSQTHAKECTGVSMERLGNLVVGTVILGSAVNVRIADESDKEGELNKFLLAITRAAWGP